MSAMDLSTIRAFVRTSLDTDSDELPDSLLDVFIGEGFNNLIEASTKWSFYAVEDTLSSVAGQQEYNIAGVDALRDNAFTYAYRSITDVRGETWSLRPLQHAAIRASMRVDSPATARPWGFSEHGDSIFLWPIPDGVYAFEVSGFRAPIDWVALGAGSEPDAPVEFHEVVAYHALARGFAQQLDLETASYYSQMFDRRVAQLVKRYTSKRTAGPFVQNGGLRVDPYTRNGLGPLIYPFE